MAVDIVLQSRLLFPFRELALAAFARVREHSDHLLDLLDRHQIPASSGVSGLTARFAFACGWTIQALWQNRWRDVFEPFPKSIHALRIKPSGALFS
jgi:hypothetical protein